MTVNEAIMQVDALKPNMYPASRKVEWLNQLDGMLYQDVILTHEDGDPGMPCSRVAPCGIVPRGWCGMAQRGERPPFVPYDPDGDLSDTLIVPFPYDTVYRFWLESQIDLANAEMAKYNVSAALYNQALLEYQGWYNRNHRPISRVMGIRL